MGTMFLTHLKKQASSFLQEKYKNARLAFTDVTQTELLAEEATNSSSWGPDAKTMTRIAEASFDIDDYWRIVDVLHRRFYSIDWKQWRQSYKSLVLLEFLLTHGPEEFAEEFQCDADVIQQLGTFHHIDENGFNWGVNMQKKSEWVLELLSGGDTLKEARLKALKITKEIQGFGNSLIIGSPSSSSCSTPSSMNSEGVSMSSFGSYSSASTLFDMNETSNNHEKTSSPTMKDLGLDKYDDQDYSSMFNEGVGEENNHNWNCPTIQEEGSLLDLTEENADFEEKYGFMRGICLKFGVQNLSVCNNNNKKELLANIISDIGKLEKKKTIAKFPWDLN